MLRIMQRGVRIKPICLALSTNGIGVALIDFFYFEIRWLKLRQNLCTVSADDKRSLLTDVMLVKSYFQVKNIKFSGLTSVISKIQKCRS